MPRVQPVPAQAHEDTLKYETRECNVSIVVETAYVGEPAATGSLQIVLKVGGSVVAEGTVPVSAPLGFTANDCLDIGQALGSPVSLDYRDKAPFEFNGVIHRVHVQ